MNNQNNIVDAKETGYCTHCKKTKTVLEFIRQRGNKTKKFAICNPCTEKSRQSIQNARSANAESDSSLTLIDDDETGIEIVDSDENNDGLLYDLCDLEDLVLTNFKSEEEYDHVAFSVKVKIEGELVNEEAPSPEFDPK
ncbi:hypothetical protein C2G38_2213067 [Gigaspora rosea]|uniref:Stc1 domain-containing protein n=1 Tax=Gigaspora rosea TaxID=44941 RepID=A0A397UE62_9GLOM|nr:hypothetical protein C2G38_2213067 [Gigaspora rosea]